MEASQDKHLDFPSVKSPQKSPPPAVEFKKQRYLASGFVSWLFDFP
jgi:hypothetical protein